jgi:N-acetylglucosaminyldiphosphoundecaprenol N-acetyl-beta-D-mannosaminyltransferase
MDEALAQCDEFIASGRLTGRSHQIATVNADFVVNSLNDPELRRILQDCDMATADGMPLVWASRLLGGPLPGRVTGADMVPSLAERAAQRGYSIFFLGARPGIAARAAEILQQRFPGLKIAGILSPPPGSVLEMDRSSVDAVKAARPDILLVAFGNPKQEKWIRMYAHELNVPICIGIGGTLDMIVGVTRRAPIWMQKSGLEWIYRLGQEPRRLAKRYLHDFGYFGYFFLRQWWAMRRGTAMRITLREHPPSGDKPPAPPAPVPAQPASAQYLLAPDQAHDHLEHAADLQVLHVRGWLEVSNLASFVEQANHALDTSSVLAIDLSGAQFLDSSALGALIALANRARAADGDVWLIAVPAPILSLLQLVHLDKFFERYPTQAAAQHRRQAVGEPAMQNQDVNGWSIVHMPRLVDAVTAPDILERASQRLGRSPRLILDCGETVFLASAGMAMLIKLDRLARERGGALRITACSSDVRRTLELVKLDNILQLYPDVDSAVRNAIQADQPSAGSSIDDAHLPSPLRT